MTRWALWGALGALAGCGEAPGEGPRLQTYGAFNNPLCFLICQTAIEAVDAEGGGSATGGAIQQSETASPGGGA